MMSADGQANSTSSIKSKSILDGVPVKGLSETFPTLSAQPTKQPNAPSAVASPSDSLVPAGLVPVSSCPLCGAAIYGPKETTVGKPIQTFPTCDCNRKKSKTLADVMQTK